MLESTLASAVVVPHLPPKREDIESNLNFPGARLVEYPDLDIESAEGDRCDPLCMQIIRIKTITCRAREH